MSRVSTLEVIIEGDASRLVGALNTGAKATQGFGTKVSATAKTTGSMFNALGIGAAAAGFAVAAFARRSVQAAIDYDRAFARIAAVTNTSGDAIESMKPQVMDLAGETAQAPVALADALYFLSSSGLDAAQVSETLEMAAKGAAIGLGAAADTSRLTSSALVAFQQDGLTATQVFDSLTAAIREGNAEPAEFADALGRVMPIAAEVGITFDQVTASLAAMSRSGLDVNEGVTALRGLLQSLAAPTQQTQDALANIGLTADDVRASLADQGLIGTLRMLDEATGGNIDQMKLLVPNVRALTGVLNLTGQSAQSVDDVFQSVLDSTGDLSEAFRVTAESDAFKVQQALNDIDVAGQQRAASTLPALADGLSAIVPLLVAILPTAVQVGAAFMAWKALAFVPQLLMQVAVGLEAVGAAGASGSIEKVSYALSGLAARATLAYVAFQTFRNASAGAAAQAAGDWEKVAQTALRQMQLVQPGLAFAIPKIETSDVAAFTAGVADLQAQIGAGTVTDEDATKRLEDLAGAMNVTLPAGAAAMVAAMKEAESGTIAARLAAEASTASMEENTAAAVNFGRSFDTIAGKSKGLADVLDLMGTDLAAFKDEALTAFKEGGASFAEFSSKTLADAENAWLDYHATVVEALTFAPSLIADLESAAATATASLAGDTSSMTSADLTTLRSDANVTAQEVLRAFRTAHQQTLDFGDDLLTISKTGGQAGEDLATAFLEAGNTLAADAVANAPAAFREKIVREFGRGETAASDLSTKLVNSIAGPLNTIAGILKAIARKWGITVTADTSKARETINDFNGYLDGVLTDRELYVIVHTKAGSPWPDEALKSRLTDPMKRMGFLKIAGRWTLPLDVKVHSDTGGVFTSDVGSVEAFTSRVLKAKEKDNTAWLQEVQMAALEHALENRSGPQWKPPTFDPTASPPRLPTTIRLDRRRFADELSYDAVYRGW